RQYLADLGPAKYTSRPPAETPFSITFSRLPAFPHSPEFKIHRLEGSTMASFKSLYRKRSAAGPSCLPRYSRRRILPDTARRLLTTWQGNAGHSCRLTRSGLEISDRHLGAARQNPSSNVT